jgi:hypothetical protein
MDLFSIDGVSSLSGKVGLILGAFAILFLVRAASGGKPDSLDPVRRRSRRLRER